MSVTQITTRDTLLEKERYGLDLTMLANDGGTLKVSVGSLIEAGGALYIVQTAAATPTGAAGAGKYLFFDSSVPGFVWDAAPGTYSAAKGAPYDGSDRRQCRFRLKSATTWDIVIAPESPDLVIEGDLSIDGATLVDSLGAAGLITESLGITGGYVEGNAKTGNELFDLLNPILGSTPGDWIILNGSVFDVSEADGIVCARARRVSATQINIDGALYSGGSGVGNIWAIGFTDASASTYKVSISW